MFASLPACLQRFCVDYISDETLPLFHDQIQIGRLDNVRFVYLALGMTLEHVRAQENRALRVACRTGRDDVARWLYGLGLTLNDVRSKKNYAFRHACANGQERTARWLWSLGLSVEDAQCKKNSAFRHTCDNGHESVARWLFGLFGPGTLLVEWQCDGEYSESRPTFWKILPSSTVEMLNLAKCEVNRELWPRNDIYVSWTHYVHEPLDTYSLVRRIPLEEQFRRLFFHKRDAALTLSRPDFRWLVTATSNDWMRLAAQQNSVPQAALSWQSIRRFSPAHISPAWQLYHPQLCYLETRFIGPRSEI